MFGSVITALISGILMSVQGVFNTRVTEKAGIWFTTGIINFTGFLFCILILLFVRDENIPGLKQVNKLYLLGGVIGACITYTVIIAIGSLGPAYAVMLILISQTLSAYLIELFGLFQTEKSPFMWSKVVGVGVMIVGIIIFQWKH